MCPALGVSVQSASKMLFWLLIQNLLASGMSAWISRVNAPSCTDMLKLLFYVPLTRISAGSTD